MLLVTGAARPGLGRLQPGRRVKVADAQAPGAKGLLKEEVESDRWGSDAV